MASRQFPGEGKYKLVWRESLELGLLERILEGKTEVRD